jgi:hypothetical protein
MEAPCSCQICSEVKAIIQSWLDKQGHEKCWYYPDLFMNLAGLLDLQSKHQPALPSRDEFEKGCKRYQDQEFGQNVQG